MGSIYVQLCTALVIGVYLSENISVGNALIFILALLLTSVLRKLVTKKFFSHRTVILAVAAFGIILTNSAVSGKLPSADELEENFVELYGQITEIPEYGEDINVYTLKAARIVYLDKIHNINEKIKVSSTEKFKFGESVIVKGFLEPFEEKMNSGDFDISRYYKGKDIFYRIHAHEIARTRTKYKNYSVNFYVNMLKSKIADSIYKNYDGDDAAILIAVTTGYKRAFSEQFKDELLKSNTSRMFYPVNIHLSVLAMIIGLAGAYVSKRLRDKILILLLVIYAIYNIDSNFIIKSALLAAILLYSKYKTGFSNFMDLLAIVVGILVLINPLTAFETGFVLSVAANILIHYFLPAASEKLGMIRNIRVRNIISLWLVMAVGMLPLQAYYFNVTTPYALLINIFAMPLLCILCTLTPINVMFGVIPPFSWTVDGLLYLMKNIPGVMARLPGYRINIPIPGIAGILIFYALLYIAYKKLYKGRRHDYSVKTVMIFVIGLVISLLSGLYVNLNKLEINFVNVGQGDGAILSIPLHETLIIDGGGNSAINDYDYGKEIFLPYLMRKGHTIVDVAIVSHFHSDHCLGVIAAMETLKVRDVVISDTLPDNENRRKIESLAEEKNINLVYCKAGMRMRFKSGLILEFIAPDESELQAAEENDTSFGIKVSYGDFSALFTGDMSASVEKNHSGEWGDCDVLKVAHHGSDTSSSAMFLAETSPEVAVISAGIDNPYGLPNKNVLERLKNSAVYRTDISGDITVLADKSGGYTVKGFSKTGIIDSFN